MHEVWRDIPEYEGTYMISNFGRVKRLPKIVNCKGGKRRLKEIIRKNGTDSGGYCYITINNRLYLIHRLVAIAFIPNPNNYPEVNHKDENKTNNFVYVNPDGTIDIDKSNLEWCSKEYNLKYGTRGIKISNSNSKPIVQYDLNHNYINEYSSITSASKFINKSRNPINACVKHKQKTAHGYIWEYK